MKLRDYQEEARTAIANEWEKGVKKTLLVLPTGCGKTIVFSKVVEDRVKLGERGAIFCHPPPVSRCRTARKRVRHFVFFCYRKGGTKLPK